MGLRLLVLLFWMFFVAISGCAFAGWQEPQVILEGVWGEEEGRFGFADFDTEDTYPGIAAILPNGMILIDDDLYNRMHLFDKEGQFVKTIVPILVEKLPEVERYRYLEYGIRDAVRYTNKGTAIGRKVKGFYEYDSSGNWIEEYEEGSLDGGVIENKRQGDGTYITEITYEDRIYKINIEADNIVRDANGYLYVRGGMDAIDPVSKTDSVAYLVHKYDICGREVGKLVMPITEHEPLLEEDMDSIAGPEWIVRNEYSEPVIGPDGSIYAHKRTPDTYSILKWEWVDDPNDPLPGPDAPSELGVTPSTTGLYLTWQPSPQDPGCVSHYEIERAGSADGNYSSIATIEAGTLNYSDEGASAGSTYFYKIRASAGGSYSDYTETVSGTRPQ